MGKSIRHKWVNSVIECDTFNAYKYGYINYLIVYVFKSVTLIIAGFFIVLLELFAFVILYGFEYA